MSIRYITSRKSEIVNSILLAKKNPNSESFIMEGSKFVNDCPPESIKALFVINAEKYQNLINKVENSYLVNKSVMDKLCDVVSDQEVLALVTKKNQEMPNKLIILDDVQDSGNVGTIIRTAAALGFGVVVSMQSANPFSAKTVRSTAGAIINCFVCRKNIFEFINKEKDFYIVSSELDKKAKHLDELLIPKKCAIIIGNEGKGVRKEISELANERVYIPIKNAESLNAAVAAGIIMYSMRLK